MADEFDVDAMLEAAFESKHRDDYSPAKKNGHHSGNGNSYSNDPDEEEEYGPKVLRKPSEEKERSRNDRDRDHRMNRDRKPRRSRSRSRDRRRSRDRGNRDRKRSRSRDRERDSRRDRDRDRDTRRRRNSRSRSRDRRRRSRSPRDRVERVRIDPGTPPRLKLGPRRSRSPLALDGDSVLTPEERDARTVFCMQLSQRIRARDLEDFFSTVGKVRDVRMITCNKTRRFKGIAYIEFRDIESVPLALGLGGQKVLGVPIIVQPSQAEKNRAGQLAKAGAMAAAMATSTPGPMKLYVGSLHFNITEEMLKGIFEPFGRIDEILLMKDHETQRSKGFGFLTFHEGEDAKRAMEQLNGFEIAGRPMKVGYVTEKTEGAVYHNPQNFLDTDEMDRAGVNLGVTGRLQLMAKLAEGTDLKLPEAATTALNMQNQITLPYQSLSPSAAQAATVPPIATQCFMLSNMFDPTQELGNPKFESELKDEVIEACLPHGGAVHVYVDMTSPTGNVYIKCPSISAAVAAVNTLHGRWFGGRVITAAYVPLLNYHSLFSDAMAAQTLLEPSKK